MHVPSHSAPRPQLAPRFSAILFDLGDTLVDFKPVDTRQMLRLASREAYAYLGSLGAKLPSHERFYRSQFWSLHRAVLWSHVRRRDFNSLDLLRRSCRRFGVDDDDSTLNELAWRWYAPIIPYTTIEPQLPATLHTLRTAGIKLGLVSNTFVPGVVHDRHLSAAGLLEFFPVRIYSCETRFRKPHRRIFELALSALKSEARRTLFVGDRMDTDILGARRAGMCAALKDPKRASSQNGAHHVIGSIHELRSIVFPAS